MLAANGDIGLVSTDLDLLSIIEQVYLLGYARPWLPCRGTVLADGFDFLDLVR